MCHLCLICKFIFHILLKGTVHPKNVNCHNLLFRHTVALCEEQPNIKSHFCSLRWPFIFMEQKSEVLNFSFCGSPKKKGQTDFGWAISFRVFSNLVHLSPPNRARFSSYVWTNQTNWFQTPKSEPDSSSSHLSSFRQIQLELQEKKSWLFQAT